MITVTIEGPQGARKSMLARALKAWAEWSGKKVGLHDGMDRDMPELPLDLFIIVTSRAAP